MVVKCTQKYPAARPFCWWRRCFLKNKQKHFRCSWAVIHAFSSWKLPLSRHLCKSWNQLGSNKISVQSTPLFLCVFFPWQIRHTKLPACNLTLTEEQTDIKGWSSPKWNPLVAWGMVYAFSFNYWKRLCPMTDYHHRVSPNPDHHTGTALLSNWWH